MNLVTVSELDSMTYVHCVTPVVAAKTSHVTGYTSQCVPLFNRDVSIACFSCYFTCLAVSLRVYIFVWTVSGTSVAFLGITRNSDASAFICFSLLEGESGIGNQAVIAPEL